MLEHSIFKLFGHMPDEVNRPGNEVVYFKETIIMKEFARKTICYRNGKSLKGNKQ